MSKKPPKTPWKDVSDSSYFRRVMRNMGALGFGPRKAAVGYVRFGITGTGYGPNYQIEGPDDTRHCYWGRGHKEASTSDDEFAAQNLSDERFTYQDIQGLLSGLL